MSDKFVLTINNSRQNYIYFNVTFACFDVLLATLASNANDFIAELGEFTIEDFRRLLNRMKNLEFQALQMNEMHVIIIAAVLNYTCFSLLNEEEEKIIQKIMFEKGHDTFYETRNKILNFATYIIGYLKTNLTHCKRFLSVIQWLES